MKFAVVGTGVVGGILGACLIKKGHEVALVDASRERLKCLKELGLTVHDPKNFIQGHFALKPLHLYSSLTEIKNFHPDVVFICVKACVLKRIIPAIKEMIEPSMYLVSFQNGLDTEELLAHELGARDNILRAVINYAGRLLEDGSIEVGFFNRPNYIGALNEDARRAAGELSQILTQSSLDTTYTKEIKKHVWEKVILNSAMSPLSALTGLNMKDVIALPELRLVVEGIVREGIAVAASTGVLFADDFLSHSMEYLSKGGPHKPSMLVDIESKRETEIDFLNGAICKNGALNQVDVDRNQTITALIKGLEANIRGKGSL